MNTQTDTEKIQALMVTFYHWIIPSRKQYQDRKRRELLEDWIKTRKNSLKYQNYATVYWEDEIGNALPLLTFEECESWHGQPFSLCKKCQNSISRLSFYFENDVMEGRAICQNKKCQHIPFYSCIYLELGDDE